MAYRSTKLFGPFSACFRQHRAESHCRFIHGYGLTFRIQFEANELDVRNWCVDFGSLKSFKGMLEDQFDHKLVLAEDDPHLDELMSLDTLGLAQVRLLPAIGCERFAQYVYDAAEAWLQSNGYAPRVHVAQVECWEHDTNSAIYTGAV